MADLEQLKTKYASVLTLIKGRNVRLDHLHIQEGKLFMQGAAPNNEIKNEVWNAIKAVDPTYSDLACDLSIDPSLPLPAAKAETYEVKSGDTLSKIAQHYYGDASQYTKIFEANKDQLSDPNKIQVGQRLNIPAPRTT